MPGATVIQFKTYEDVNGMLCAYERGQSIPFDIRRVFTVVAMAGNTRGEHAHKRCAQVLICLSGKIRVSCDDGSEVTRHLLDGMGTGLHVPPGIWAVEEYLTDGAVLMVLCDRPYEADDYIRDYEAFRASRQN
jgi:dTDP-4-dehydrorhamnose 3,5-epimerase-like enzyme